MATAHVLATEYGVTGRTKFKTGVGNLSVVPGNHGYEMSLPVFDLEMIDPAPQWVTEFFGNGCIKTFRNFENHYA